MLIHLLAAVGPNCTLLRRISRPLSTPSSRTRCLKCWKTCFVRYVELTLLTIPTILTYTVQSSEYRVILYSVLLPPGHIAYQGTSKRLFKSRAIPTGNASPLISNILKIDFQLQRMFRLRSPIMLRRLQLPCGMLPLWTW